MLASANPARSVMDDGGRRDLHLGWKQAIPRAQAAGAKDMTGRKGTPLPPDDHHQDEDDDDDADCGEHPGRLEVQLIHKPSRARLARLRWGVGEACASREDAKLAASRDTTAGTTSLCPTAPQDPQ